MGRKTFIAALLALNVAACFTLPQQQKQQHHLRSLLSNVENQESFVMGEGLVEANLQIKPSSHGKEKLELIDPHFTSYNRPVVTEASVKSENDPVDFESEDELIESAKLKDHSALSNNNERTALRLPSGGAVNVASSNPIYITIPIYINKAEGQPLRLSVGGHDIPLAPKTGSKNSNNEPLSPTSQYNRLLQHNTVDTKHTKSSTRKSSKKKKLRHTSARFSPRKSHHSHKEEKSRKSQKFKDSNQPIYYRFYF